MEIAELHELDVKIKSCDGCYLCRNIHQLPIWSPKVRYVLYTEHPFKEKPKFMKDFWKLAKEFSLEEEYFLQISTVQCFPDMNKRTKKYNRPSIIHRSECRKWFDEYIKIIKPKKMIVFGNIPMEECIGEFKGITDHHGMVIKPRLNNRVVQTVLSLPPSIMKNNPKGKEKMKEVLRIFKEL